MDTFLAIVSKRDQRQYADREIPEEVLERILQAGRLAGSAMNRQPFASWSEVRHYCQTHAWIYYQAPLDLHPVVAAVWRIFKNGKGRLDYHGNRFTIDAAHLSRCSHPGVGRHDDRPLRW